MALPPDSTTVRSCPRCGQEITPTPIVYGYPSGEMFESAERGEIRLGGCIIGDESPEFECPQCHASLPWMAEAGLRVDGLASISFGR
jgi:hypothetical protein